MRAGAGDSGDSDTGVLTETLLAGLGALLVLVFVFRSFTALLPLLMAIVAIPTTFLLVWPIANITDVSVIVQYLVALIGLGIAAACLFVSHYVLGFTSTLADNVAGNGVGLVLGTAFRFAAYKALVFRSTDARRTKGFAA